MAKAVQWRNFGAKVNPTGNIYNTYYKNFRHQGTPESAQALDEIDISVAYEEPIEDYIADIRERSKGLISPTITHSSYAVHEDEYDAYSETQSTIKGWRAELTEPEKNAVREYFEGISIVE